MEPPPTIHLGTSSFTAAGWQGSFYPSGMKSRDYLRFYAERFDTVEVDSTFYRCPSPATVSGWALKTPEGFIFSVKVPRVITHEKVLVECDAEFEQFLNTMSILGDKLGPMVLQFPYFHRGSFNSVSEFLARLTPFMKRLPRNHTFAVEIRNKHWLDARFADALREHRLALVLPDREWLPRPSEVFEKFDAITADFTYIRWLGDRKGIEQQTKTWDKTIVDRTQELSSWVDVCERIQRRGVTTYAYANNHYAGHAPATVALFRDLWRAKGLAELDQPRKMEKEPTLFD